MNGKLKQQLKRLIRISFRVSPSLSAQVWNVVCLYIFRDERRAYRGKLKQPQGDRKSIVFFSHNRCASMMLNKRIQELMEGCGYRNIDYQRLVHGWPEKEREAFRWDAEVHSASGRFLPKMFYYGVFRYYVDILGLENMHPILVLRDPRDVITSRYFSEAFAHVALDKVFHEHTERVRKMDVDTFVKTFAKDVEEHYSHFRENYSKMEQGVIWKYEDLIDDFEGFLVDVNEKCNLGKSGKFVAEIASKESFKVSSEDKFSHKRSVKAGSYLCLLYTSPSPRDRG